MLGLFQATLGSKTSRQDFSPKKSSKSILSLYASITFAESKKRSERQLFKKFDKPHLGHIFKRKIKITEQNFFQKVGHFLI